VFAPGAATCIAAPFVVGGAAETPATAADGTCAGITGITVLFSEAAAGSDLSTFTFSFDAVAVAVAAAGEAAAFAAALGFAASAASSLTVVLISERTVTVGATSSAFGVVFACALEDAFSSAFGVVFACALEDAISRMPE
jgi:hypothetical protein